MWPNPQFPVDLVTFTEEFLNAKLHFMCSVIFLFLFAYSWAKERVEIGVTTMVLEKWKGCNWKYTELCSIK